MKQLIYIFLLFLPGPIQAQEAKLDQILAELEFGQDTVETVFLWITDNIKYDVNLKEELIEMNKKGVDRRGNRVAYENELLNKVLASKKGVCQDYSILMNGLLHRLGYESVMVPGYTRNANGKINYNGGHSWNAVKVSGEWRLYDATWAAGSVKEDSKFIKHYNPQWNNTPPEEMIKTHMPFDPIWQLLPRPVKYNDFEKSNFDRGDGPSLDYNTLISEHLEKSESSQSIASLERSKNMGSGNKLVKRWQANREKEMESLKKMNTAKQFQAISGELNKMAGQYNEYIKAKNNRFKSKKWNLEYAQSFMSGLKAQCEKYDNFFKSTDTNGAEEKRFVASSMKHLKKFQRQVDKEIKFLLIKVEKNKK